MEQDKPPTPLLLNPDTPIQVVFPPIQELASVFESLEVAISNDLQGLMIDNTPGNEIFYTDKAVLEKVSVSGKGELPELDMTDPWSPESNAQSDSTTGSKGDMSN